MADDTDIYQAGTFTAPSSDWMSSGSGNNQNYSDVINAVLGPPPNPVSSLGIADTVVTPATDTAPAVTPATATQSGMDKGLTDWFSAIGTKIGNAAAQMQTALAGAQAVGQQTAQLGQQASAAAGASKTAEAGISVNDATQAANQAAADAQAAARAGLTGDNINKSLDALHSNLSDIENLTTARNKASSVDFWGDPINYIYNRVVTLPHLDNQLSSRVDNVRAIQTGLEGEIKGFNAAQLGDAALNSVNTQKRAALVATKGAADAALAAIEPLQKAEQIQLSAYQTQGSLGGEIVKAQDALANLPLKQSQTAVQIEYAGQVKADTLQKLQLMNEQKRQQLLGEPDVVALRETKIKLFQAKLDDLVKANQEKQARIDSLRQSVNSSTIDPATKQINMDKLNKEINDTSSAYQEAFTRAQLQKEQRDKATVDYENVKAGAVQGMVQDDKASTNLANLALTNVGMKPISNINDLPKDKKIMAVDAGLALQAGAGLGTNPLNAMKFIQNFGVPESSLPAGHLQMMRDIQASQAALTQQAIQQGLKGQQIEEAVGNGITSYYANRQAILQDNAQQQDPIFSPKSLNVLTSQPWAKDNPVLNAMSPLLVDGKGNKLDSIPFRYKDAFAAGLERVNAGKLSVKDFVNAIYDIQRNSSKDNNEAYGFKRFGIPYDPDNYVVALPRAEGGTAPDTGKPYLTNLNLANKAQVMKYATNYLKSSAYTSNLGDQAPAPDTVLWSQ